MVITRTGLAAALVGLCAIATLVAAERWTQPRMTWGDPDLEGVWTSDNNFSIPLERPADVADKEFLDGKEFEDALATLVAAERWTQPRMTWGDPDLEGV